MSSPREAFKDAKTIVVKVGTSVVTRPDGSLAIGRIASVVEQIATLHHAGKRVVLVASGAIGVGATRLREQATLTRSVRSHLHGGTVAETSARARAAAGQGGLMGLYENLFSQYSVSVGQLLVTEADFSSPQRKESFCRSLRWLLDHDGVPLINENDVVAQPVRACASAPAMMHKRRTPPRLPTSYIALVFAASLFSLRRCANSSPTTIRSRC